MKYPIVLVCALVAASFSFVIVYEYISLDKITPTYDRALKPKRATILFGGDIMFDRSVRTAIDKKGGDFIFSCIDSVLENVDLVVANLEGPITKHASVSASSTPGGEFNYTFTFPPATAELLYAHNIRMVNLGNNHIRNFGNEGVRSTIASLEKAGVAYFGDPIDYKVAEGRVNGVPLAFVNYNEFGGNASTTRVQINKARADGFLPIAYTHWGIEYATTSSAYSRELAHSFIDAGAEMVIGSHPHVVEEREAYRGKPIYYSLGNFIFDQYFSEDVRNGLLLAVKFGQNGVVAVKEIPVYLERDRRTCQVE